VAVVESGKLVAKYESVPLRRLIRLIWEYKPRILALDNIYELAPSERELARIVSMFPDTVEIVQVTRAPDGTLYDLRALASMLGINVGPKLSPQKTAYIVALLAEKGYGSRVRFLEEKTKIVIRRGRCGSEGGMSQQRYQRRLRAAILRATKRVKELLDKHRFDYDLVFRKSGGGLDSAVFIVYAPRDALNGIIKPHNGNDIIVEIKPVYSSHIVFEKPQRHHEKPRYLIVGIDPGMYTAVAGIDLEGRLVFVESRRGMDRLSIVELIYRHGIPVLIASDVKPAPDLVRKLASSLHVPLFEAPRDMRVEEKQELVERFLARHSTKIQLDSHQRDALAAAIKAYHSLESKLRQAESYVLKLGLDVDLEAVKAAIIRGVSLAEAIEEEIERRIAEAEAEPVLQKRLVRKQNAGEGANRKVEERLRAKLEELEAENRSLQLKVKMLEEEVERLQRELRLVKAELDPQLEAERRVEELKRTLDLVRRELENLRREKIKLEDLFRKTVNYIPEIFLGRVAIGFTLPLLSPEKVKELVRSYGEYLRGALVAIEDINPVYLDQVDILLEKGIAGVLIPRSRLDYKTTFEDRNVPVLPLEDYLLEKFGPLALLRPEAYTEAILKKLLLEEEKKRKEEAKKFLSKDELLKMFEEYRIQRARELFGEA